MTRDSYVWPPTVQDDVAEPVARVSIQGKEGRSAKARAKVGAPVSVVPSGLGWG